MSETVTITVDEKGVIAIPASVLQHYNLQPGDKMMLVDLDGVLVLHPSEDDVDILANNIGSKLTAKGEILDTLMQAVREQREQYNS